MCFLSLDADGLSFCLCRLDGGRGKALFFLDKGPPPFVHTDSSPGRASGRGGFGGEEATPCIDLSCMRV